ncbi:type III polyketide synthase [Bacillus massiliglaciei]|uniref:type III polyketide synthase n=1 Tax=Bacillus massiliglaciei TaxID=1816693 RepID=UPI000AA2A439|nr:3-oxoacyl-[acyl-carrier-protein] synthase III C-terminal domain-containing protein [Bacillus massiliglaciei]
MPFVLSVSHIDLPYALTQETVREFSRELFGSSFTNIDRLLKVFKNGQVENRFLSNDLDWFKKDHTFEEKNDLYIEQAVQYGAIAVKDCLENEQFLDAPVSAADIDAFIFVSSTGVATPSIEARIMNILPINPHAKRIPLWGLGCAGGGSGLSRAFEYCKAYPKAKVLVLTVELCSLTFQKNDVSKSNLIGTSLFSDGVACALICGDEAAEGIRTKREERFSILDTQSTLMPDSLDVMGWNVKNEGLYVIFSKDIPSIVENWLKPNVLTFLQANSIFLEDIAHFIAHPGGKKVIEAYEEALGFGPEMTKISMDILKNYGNMSSATILYVLERHLELGPDDGEYGLAAALGPGFSSELLLMRWIS